MSSGYYRYGCCVFNDQKCLVFEMKRIYDGDIETAHENTVEFISVYKTTHDPVTGVGCHPYRWIRDFDTKNLESAVVEYEHAIPLVAV